MVSALACQSLHSGSIHAERVWQVSRIGTFALRYLFFIFQNLALELGFGQGCQLEIVNRNAKRND